MQGIPILIQSQRISHFGLMRNRKCQNIVIIRRPSTLCILFNCCWQHGEGGGGVWFSGVVCPATTQRCNDSPQVARDKGARAHPNCIYGFPYANYNGFVAITMYCAFWYMLLGTVFTYFVYLKFCILQYQTLCNNNTHSNA